MESYDYNRVCKLLTDIVHEMKASRNNAPQKTLHTNSLKCSIYILTQRLLRSTALSSARRCLLLLVTWNFEQYPLYHAKKQALCTTEHMQGLQHSIEFGCACLLNAHTLHKLQRKLPQPAIHAGAVVHIISS